MLPPPSAMLGTVSTLCPTGCITAGCWQCGMTMDVGSSPVAGFAHRTGQTCTGHPDPHTSPVSCLCTEWGVSQGLGSPEPWGPSHLCWAWRAVSVHNPPSICCYPCPALCRARVLPHQRQWKIAVQIFMMIHGGAEQGHGGDSWGATFRVSRSSSQSTCPQAPSPLCSEGRGAPSPCTRAFGHKTRALTLPYQMATPKHQCSHQSPTWFCHVLPSQCDSESCVAPFYCRYCCDLLSSECVLPDDIYKDTYIHDTKGLVQSLTFLGSSTLVFLSQQCCVVPLEVVWLCSPLVPHPRFVGQFGFPWWFVLLLFVGFPYFPQSQQNLMCFPV